MALAGDKHVTAVEGELQRLLLIMLLGVPEENVLLFNTDSENHPFFKKKQQLSPSF